MLKKKHNDIVWFEFEKLQNYPQLRHAIFSRSGGMSKGPYFGLNLSDTVGDESNLVQENRRMAFSAAGLPSPPASAIQVHGARVCALQEVTEHKIPSCDALTTNKKGIPLSIQHADCQAAIFFDPVATAIACVHSGWRGNCQNIYKETIMKMQQQFGTKPSDLIVCISPSLGPTKAEFTNYSNELPESFWPFGDANHYFNLWEIARWQLEQEGVKPDHIEIAGLCTYLNPNHFYSYRRDKLCGRNLTCVWLK